MFTGLILACVVSNGEILGCRSASSPQLFDSFEICLEDARRVAEQHETALQANGLEVFVVASCHEWEYSEPT